MKKFLYGLALSFFLVSIALGQVIYDRTDKVKIAWSSPDFKGCDAQPLAPIDCLLYWDVQLIRNNGEIFNFQAPPGALSFEMVRPKSGVYVVRVRAVAKSCCDGITPCYMAWAESTDPLYSTLEDGVTPGAWEIRFKPSAPTGPIIIY
jgi:hypothetical protein